MQGIKRGKGNPVGERTAGEGKLGKGKAEPATCSGSQQWGCFESDLIFFDISYLFIGGL